MSKYTPQKPLRNQETVDNNSAFCTHFAGEPVIRRVDAAQNETTVQIACRPVGLPPPVVSYWAGGSILDALPGHRVIGGQMLIARDWLRKVYVCSAGNKHGTDSVNLTGKEGEEGCV